MSRFRAQDGMTLPEVLVAATVGFIVLAATLGLLESSVRLNTGVMAKTWKPVEEHGTLSAQDRKELPDSAFAFPDKRKEPLTDAKHVRNAVARFDQVEGVSDSERDRAWRRIKAAAKRFDVEIEARSWRELFDGGKGPTKKKKH